MRSLSKSLFMRMLVTMIVCEISVLFSLAVMQAQQNHLYSYRCRIISNAKPGDMFCDFVASYGSPYYFASDGGLPRGCKIASFLFSNESMFSVLVNDSGSIVSIGPVTPCGPVTSWYRFLTPLLGRPLAY